MAEAIKVVVEPREEKGKEAMKRLRREGLLPGIVYGMGEQAEMIQLNERDFENVLRKHASEHMVMDLYCGKGEPRKVLLQEVQHHPVTGRILHIDFNEISMTEKLRVDVPVELVGEPEGVTQQGGVLDHLVREIEVECLPTDILEQIEVDVSALEIGDSLTVADIKLDPEKYVILTAPDIAVTAVAAPRVQEEPEVAEEEGVEVEEGAEPEVIGEKEKEEAAAEEESGKSEK